LAAELMTWSMACRHNHTTPRPRVKPRPDTASHLTAQRGRQREWSANLHREVEGHELDDRPQLLVRRAGGEAGEAGLRDGRVDDARRAELLEQALGDLVGALVLSNLLANHKDVGVARHLLEHRGTAVASARGE
jgi:hypothetical protein